MKILLTNDDGIHSKALAEVRNKVGAMHDITVVAPAEEQSAKGHSFTMSSPLFVNKVNSKQFAVSGTPADCVYIGLHQLLEDTEIVISGINIGLNMGSDLHYSGTVAAAREACLNGILGLAVSAPSTVTDWGPMAQLILKVVELLKDVGNKSAVFYNLNIPHFDSEPPQIKVCAVGRRKYKKTVDERQDPRGRPYYWIGGPPIKSVNDTNTDVYWFERGFATLSPITIDPTAHNSLESLSTLLRFKSE